MVENSVVVVVGNADSANILTLPLRKKFMIDFAEASFAPSSRKSMPSKMINDRPSIPFLMNVKRNTTKCISIPDNWQMSFS